MSRVSQVSQQQRTQNNPLVLGTFDETSLREIKGTLGPRNFVVGKKDTSQFSNGGFGGGTYNHWFQINITSPAWIITTKGGPRPNYIQVSAYDLNKIPIEGRMIFQGDSISITDNLEESYYPYIDQIMGSASDLYNTFNQNALDKGNDLYFNLNVGSYLICVSTTRNELLDYTVGIVVEMTTTEMYFLLEDITFLSQESSLNDVFLIEPSETYDFNSVHEHSQAEWLAAWRRERSPEDSLPVIFTPLLTNA
jgi:hypothetical protein